MLGSRRIFFLFSLSPKSEADTLTFISSDAKRDWLGHFAEAPDCETWGNITDPAALCAPFAAARPSHMHTQHNTHIHIGCPPCMYTVGCFYISTHEQIENFSLLSSPTANTNHSTTRVCVKYFPPRLMPGWRAVKIFPFSALWLQRTAQSNLQIASACIFLPKSCRVGFTLCSSRKSSRWALLS